ncbi:MAG TPA: Lrp/AsnC family transcriptional regulator [Actinomycetes bacterium]|nr:Lrp/AsnC family transcriptional regulator [Actinomycetes bacterium]
MSDTEIAGPGTDEQTARPLDAVDRAMVQALCEDGRIAMIDLAQRVGASRGNVYQRYERLRREGVIQGFTARVDPRRLGLPVAAYVSLKVEQDAWRGVRQKLLALPEVEHVALTTGDADFVVLVRAGDIHRLRDVILDRLRQVPGVRTTYTTLILDEQGRGTAMPG